MRSIDFSSSFTNKMKTLPTPLKKAVFSFNKLFLEHGLQDFSNFPGKTTPSWKTADTMNQNYAHKFNLWHYHCGYPHWNESKGDYLTSDYVIHYIRVSDSYIKIVDVTPHREGGSFPVPRKSMLEQKYKLMTELLNNRDIS